MEPATPGVEATVVGGDAFLVLAVEPGTEVLVPGYEGEPYPRIDPSGTIWVNLASPAHYLDDDRYGQMEVPPSVSVEAPPDWQPLAEGGLYGWHDHRIHWMSPPARSVALPAHATRTVLTAGLFAALTLPAAAHTEPDLVAVPAGSEATVALRPTHGCVDSPTVRIGVRAPVAGATAGEGDGRPQPSPMRKETPCSPGAAASSPPTKKGSSR